MESYWITNVRLEMAYFFENGTVNGTDTDIFHLQIENGKIQEIVNSSTPLEGVLPIYDANNFLMLPAFNEMHIHVDKTYYGSPWKAVNPVNSIFERIAEEKELLPKLQPTVKDRAAKMLDLLLYNGSTHVRTHCNIDPTVGLKNLEATVEVLETYSDRLSSEIVAFPQHGLLRSDSVNLVKQAMEQGASFVGGVDPYTVDGDIDKSLTTIFDIATQSNAGVDIHIHDRGEIGIKTMNKLADLTEDASMQHNVTASHAFAFASGDSRAVWELAERFAELGISVTSTVPIGNTIMPLPTLHEKGINVGLGTDSITDHWSPFGTGDNLEKVNRLAELYGYSDEWSLSQSLGFITGGKTPLDQNGKLTWPVIGDDASAVFVNASCSAETVARKPERKAVIFKGNLVSGSF